MLPESANVIKSSSKDQLSSETEKIHIEPSENFEGQGIGDMSPEAQEYVRHLQSQLSSVEKVCGKHSIRYVQILIHLGGNIFISMRKLVHYFGFSFD